MKSYLPINERAPQDFCVMKNHRDRYEVLPLGPVSLGKLAWLGGVPVERAFCLG